MGAIASIFSSFFSWFAAQILARWTYKIALVSGIVAAYSTAYLLFISAVSVLVSLIPVSPFTAFTLQFFPSRYAVAIAGTAYFGSLAAKKAMSFFLEAYANAVKVGS